MKKFEFLKALNSPFKPFRIRFYFGVIKIGVPYFLPRKSVPNKDNPGYLKFIPKKIGFDFCGIGWKTKWSDTDYRIEWEPVFSFVFFKWQIALIFIAPHSDQYWSSFLFYQRNTDKKKTKLQRIQHCIQEYPQNWTRWSDGKKESIDYYKLILRKKYRPKSIDEIRESKLKNLIDNNQN